MKTSLCGLGCLLLACGGKQQVNLGDNDDSSGWANTQVSPAAATNEPAPTVAAHDGCALDYDLARWRYDEDGAEREWVILDDVSFDQGSFRGVFDGEVVWSAPDNGLWSCLADACAATKRQVGIGGTISLAKSVIADEQFLYWTSTDCINGTECGPEWTLKRTPRIPR